MIVNIIFSLFKNNANIHISYSIVYSSCSCSWTSWKGTSYTTDAYKKHIESDILRKKYDLDTTLIIFRGLASVLFAKNETMNPYTKQHSSSTREMTLLEFLIGLKASFEHSTEYNIVNLRHYGQDSMETDQCNDGHFYDPNLDGYYGTYRFDPQAYTYVIKFIYKNSDKPCPRGWRQLFLTSKGLLDMCRFEACVNPHNFFNTYLTYLGHNDFYQTSPALRAVCEQSSSDASPLSHRPLMSDNPYVKSLNVLKRILDLT